MSGTDASILKRFMISLPQADRYILMMHYTDGLNTTEIGLVLDLPEYQVSERLESLKADAQAALDAAAHRVEHSGLVPA